MRFLIIKPDKNEFTFPLMGLYRNSNYILCSVNILQKQIIRKSICFATFFWLTTEKEDVLKSKVKKRNRSLYIINGQFVDR